MKIKTGKISDFGFVSGTSKDDSFCGIIVGSGGMIVILSFGLTMTSGVMGIGSKIVSGIGSTAG